MRVTSGRAFCRASHSYTSPVPGIFALFAALVVVVGRVLHVAPPHKA